MVDYCSRSILQYCIRVHYYSKVIINKENTRTTYSFIIIFFFYYYTTIPIPPTSVLYYSSYSLCDRHPILMRYAQHSVQPYQKQYWLYDYYTVLYIYFAVLVRRAH